MTRIDESSETPGVRRVVLRISFVLGTEGGALPVLLRLTRRFLGGRVSLVAMRRSVELNSRISGYHRFLGMMEATLGNTAEGVAQLRLADQIGFDPQFSPNTAYSYRVIGLHDEAAKVVSAWVAPDEEFPREILAFNYHLVLDEEEQALDALVRLIENPGLVGNPTVLAMTNAFDDPTLEKPEFAALRAELRAKVGWN